MCFSHAMNVICEVNNLSVYKLHMNNDWYNAADRHRLCLYNSIYISLITYELNAN